MGEILTPASVHLFIHSHSSRYPEPSERMPKSRWPPNDFPTVQQVEMICILTNQKKLLPIEKPKMFLSKTFQFRAGKIILTANNHKLPVCENNHKFQVHILLSLASHAVYVT